MRRLLLLSSVALASLLAPALCLGQSLTVDSPAGSLTGKMDQTKGGPARAFLGIPYAAPPVGPLRWKPPMPAAKWTGVRQATTFGARCMQSRLYPDMIFRDPGPSEDCLTLNVWTPPDAKPGAKLPVMVWIYGGGFNTGGTSEPRQDGAHLATKGVIVVSFNYRLGIFGFMALPSLAAESPEHAAGNYALLDAIAALHWVRTNIGAFGGDSGNVTIFGESAGSFAVSALMASPLGHGLFAHAIGESGAAFSGAHPAVSPLQQTEDRDMDFARTKLGTDQLVALRALPAARLLDAAATAHGPGMRFSLDVDGYLLPQTPAAIFAADKQNDVPLLAGWNHDEGGDGKATAVITPTGGTSVAKPADAPSDLERLKEIAQKNFGAHADEFLQAFPAQTNDEAVQQIARFNADLFIAYGTWAWLEAQTATGHAPVYRYHFDLVPPTDSLFPKRFGVFHSDDIEYVFGNLDSRHGVNWRPEDYKMSDQMMDYWSNFAKHGDPNGAGLVHWPVYSPASGSRVMELDQPSHADKDPQRDEFLFLQAAWGGRTR